jgi:hypothetical protein
MKKFILKTNLTNVFDAYNSHLTMIQKKELQKLLDIKYLFITKKTT